VCGFFFQDRILATCDLHKIRYVVDRTNFQPDLTLRNAIRHMIANNEKKRDPAVPVPVVRLSPFVLIIESESDVDFFIITMKEPRPLPPVMAHKIMQIKAASEDLKIPIPIDWMASRENLRAAVHASSRNLSDIEGRGDFTFETFPITLNCSRHIFPPPKSAPILAASPSNLPQAHSSSLPTDYLQCPWISSYNTR
jgi:tRNA(Ile)-lysidine synthase TilS/MesJ